MDIQRMLPIQLAPLNQNEESVKKTNIWDKNIQAEESGYYWKKTPIIKPLKNRQVAKLNFVELFCGCGGMSKGFEMAGYNILLGADILIPAIQTFQANHPKAATILGDLKKVSVDEMSFALKGVKIDVMGAGVPCQGFSLNNRKRNDNDERNFLFKRYMVFLKAFQPQVALLENVSGIRSANNGAFVDEIKKSFFEVGYKEVYVKVLNAAEYGVPQIRKRVFFVATRENSVFNWPAPSHGPSGIGKYRTVWDAISDLPSLKAGESASKYQIAPRCEYQKFMRSKGKLLTNHVAPNHPDSTIKKIAATEPGKPMYKHFRQRVRLHWDNPSPTQVSGGIRPQFQFGHPSQARGLTIRERCRIQSFPDNFVVEGGIVQGRVQTGNAVPPLLAKAVAESIKMIMKYDNVQDVSFV